MMTKGNQQILDAERILTTAVAPETETMLIAHAQAMLTLALVREQRAANVIAWVSQPGWTPSRDTENSIMEFLGLPVGSDESLL